MPRLMSYPAISSLPQRDTFVGRVRELSEFRNSVRYVLGVEPPPGGSPIYPHIFLPYGEGGMGKSALLHQCLRIAIDEGMPAERVILIDLGQFVPSIEGLARHLVQAIGQRHPDFGRQYHQARARRDALQPRYRELRRQWERWEAFGRDGASFDDLIDAHRRQLRILEEQQATFGRAYAPAFLRVEADRALSEISALMRFRDERGRPPESFEQLVQREFGPDAELFYEEGGVGRALAEDLFGLGEQAPMILAIDTYESADQHDDWLRESILRKSSDRMLTIIAGRNKLDAEYRDTFKGEYTNYIRSYNLNDQTLQPGEIEQYLGLRLGSPDALPAGLVREVQQISRGIPVALEALGDQLKDDGDLGPYRAMEFAALDRRSVIRTVTERFLSYALDNKGDDEPTRERKIHDRQHIRALALLLLPNAELACALWGVPADVGSEVMGRLAARYSFIFAASGMYALHDLVREFVREHTLAEGRSSFDWPVLEDGLQRALPIIRERLAQTELATPSPDERYDDGEYCQATLDLLNALLWLGAGAGARKLLLNRWVEAQHASYEFADDLAQLAAELAPKSPDWRRCVQAIKEENYNQVEQFIELLAPHARAVLCYLRAEAEDTWYISDADDLKSFNRYLALLEASHAYDRAWEPARDTLVEAYLERAGYYADTGQHDRLAQADYDRALELRPDDPDILNERAVMKSRHGDLAGALEDCDRALELRPEFVLALTNRSLLQAKQGDPAAALAGYDRALALAPADPDILYMRADLREEQGDLTGALADYDRALELAPDDPDALNDRAVVKEKQGDLAGALADYDQALELRPDFALALTNRALLKEKQGDPAGALEDYDRALELRPTDLDILYNRADLRDNQGDLAGALEDYDRALELHPADPDILNNRAVVKEKQGDLAGALEDYDRALELRPDFVLALTNRALLKEKQGDPAGALEDYDRALELRPDDPDMLYNRAALRDDQGDLAGALEDYDRALELRPDDPDMLNSRGYTRAKAGRFQAAIADLQAAIAAAPEFSLAYCSLAETYIFMGDYDTALDWLAKAIAIDPDKRQYAIEQADYDPIRADPRFIALVNLEEFI